MQKILLFDLDGTLIDSTDAILSSFHNSFLHNDFQYSGNDEDIKRLIGYPLEIMFEKLGVSEDNTKFFVDTYKKEYRKISIKQTELFYFTKKTLETAKQFARLGIVTTKTKEPTIRLLTAKNIMNYFETIIGRDDVIDPKPSAEPIFKALKEMEIDRDNCDIYMIGDTTLDLIAAKNANINGIGVLSGYGTKNELLEHSEYIFENTLDVVNYLKKL